MIKHDKTMIKHDKTMIKLRIFKSYVLLQTIGFWGRYVLIFSQAHFKQIEQFVSELRRVTCVQYVSCPKVESASGKHGLTD